MTKLQNEINVMSLFDGISCGQLALNKVGIPIKNYYASEIDKYAIQVTQKNFPKTIQLGDVTKLDFTQFKGKIDLLLGGSPCQSLSITQAKTRQGLDGKSKLFFEYIRALEEIQPKYFLFENVASMSDECKRVIISCFNGLEPIFIDSNLFSAQDRPRLYWTNIPILPINFSNNTVLKDIMEKNVPEKYFYNCNFEYLGNKKVCATLEISGHDILKRIHSPNFKCHTLTCCRGGNTQKKVLDKGRPRKLTPLEYERLQTVPDNYTDILSNSQRYNVIGNGWTVDVIAYILNGLKDIKSVEEDI